MVTSLQGGPYSAQEVQPSSRQIQLRVRNKTLHQEQVAFSSKMGKSVTGEKIPTAWVKSGKMFPLPNMYSESPGRNSGDEMHGQL